MGRRRSHHRVDDKGDGQKLGHRMPEAKLSKPKRAINEESPEIDGEVHQRSNVIKSGNKRKRDDVTRKGHAQRPKSKDPHGSKQKTKKFSRWKSFSCSESDLSGGKSSDSSMRFQSISNRSCHSHSDDSSYSSSSSREHTRKRSRVHHFEDGQIIETVNKERRKRVSSHSRRRDERMCESRLKLLREDDHEAEWHGNTEGITPEKLNQGNACYKRVTSFVVEGQQNKFMDGQAEEVCISTTLEQEQGQLSINLAEEETGLDDGTIKASLLEIELRQKALVNLMRHRDSTCGRNKQKEISNSSALTVQDAEKGEEIVEDVTVGLNQHSNINRGEETDKGSATETGDLLSMVNVISLHDRNIDENRWPLAIDIAPQKTYSLEPKQDAVEHITPRSDVAPKLGAVGDPKTVEKEKLNRGNDALCPEGTDTSPKNSLLPSEHESQLETRVKLRTTGKTSTNRDFCEDVSVSGEENNAAMANYFSEMGKPEASQAEAEGNFTISEPITTNAAQLSESVHLPCEKLCSNSEQENKGNDEVEHFEARESPIATSLPREENIKDTNSGGYIAATPVRRKSLNKRRSPNSCKDCGRDSAQSVPKPEIAPQKQEDGASMFQEKTMSVMRGGELVQVNYKVYIPKRAAELAKRRLQR